MTRGRPRSFERTPEVDADGVSLRDTVAVQDYAAAIVGALVRRGSTRTASVRCAARLCGLNERQVWKHLSNPKRIGPVDAASEDVMASIVLTRPAMARQRQQLGIEVPDDLLGPILTKRARGTSPADESTER